ncbi:hypothetical protein EEL30_21905 [Brevibacillus laterosporus]|uniref:Uncharacterized protein n=1 Tax=Brevibacillus laterosporus TaxID=1465 RepID=A0A518VCH9_BRELA|nr:hypothetical protein EEL30_21905 [Brevibacillus laterosporus]
MDIDQLGIDKRNFNNDLKENELFEQVHKSFMEFLNNPTIDNRIEHEKADEQYKEYKQQRLERLKTEAKNELGSE